jgi:hypothetical protein
MASDPSSPARSEIQGAKKCSTAGIIAPFPSPMPYNCRGAVIYFNMMSNRAVRQFHRATFCAAALLAAACPFSSEHPLGNPAEAIADDSLIGTWKTTQGSEEHLTITIRSSGERELLIEAEDPEEEPETLQAFVTELDGERFLNVRDEQWFLVNYRIEGGRLMLRIVDDELFESSSFASPEELRDFMRQNLADPRLYGAANGPDWDWELDRGESDG